MSKEIQAIIDQIQAGTYDPSSLGENAPELVQPVTLSGWEAFYSSTTGQLSGYCTATADNSGDTITGIGFVLYNSAGSQMWTLQYSNGFNGAEVATSVGTNLYTTGMGGSTLSIVYGYTENSGNFFFADTLTIGSD